MNPPIPPSGIPCVLAINGGSSSIRFAVFEVAESMPCVLSGKMDRIGPGPTTFAVSRAGEAPKSPIMLTAVDHPAAVAHLLDCLDHEPRLKDIRAIGHRVVHGMHHSAPELITPEILAELRQYIPFDPNHLPSEIALIEAVRIRYPKLPQVACFDTAFHCEMPRVAKLLPIPRRYEKQGVERCGFHGLSYAYLLEELNRLGECAARKGRVILAHLGSGASLAAVLDGQSIDTTMGFTPAAGLMMGTRSGDLDPGLLSYLSRTEKMTPAQFDSMINHESGLIGISETTADIRDLLSCEATDVRAAEAVALFCYHVRKGIGACAAALGGLDALVFAGGIGENSWVIRERICADLEFLGISLHPVKNEGNAALISTDAARVSVRVISTNEELMIARSVLQLSSANFDQ